MVLISFCYFDCYCRAGPQEYFLLFLGTNMPFELLPEPRKFRWKKYLDVLIFCQAVMIYVGHTAVQLISAKSDNYMSKNPLSDEFSISSYEGKFDEFTAGMIIFTVGDEKAAEVYPLHRFQGPYQALSRQIAPGATQAFHQYLG